MFLLHFDDFNFIRFYKKSQQLNVAGFNLLETKKLYYKISMLMKVERIDFRCDRNELCL